MADTNSRIVRLIEGVAADPAASAEAKKVAALDAFRATQRGQPEPADADRQFFTGPEAVLGAEGPRARLVAALVK
ncbi:hypothetical protein [Rugamonas rubra]|uniref:hypothetical protein n=1 Tax=Rugamonas rubra TaxID=758825 RepID=UPI000B81C531|nr:hypothetical protein [Rugamonas rubra]